MTPGLLRLLSTLAPSPSPEPGVVLPDTPPDELVTPGTIGFVVTFLVAVALVLLVRDMNRRVRRVRVRSDLADAQLRRELAEEAARKAAGGGTHPSPGVGDDPRTASDGPSEPDDGSPARRP